MRSGPFVVVHVKIHHLSISLNTSHPMLQICSELLHGYYTQFSQLVRATHTHSFHQMHLVGIGQSNRHMNKAVD